MHSCTQVLNLGHCFMAEDYCTLCF
uniref:Uncharacterized protein n=1 Tax=Anguilla anguilla TaxID=7936 RepID=A0A0E9QN53_ANGAN